MADPTDPTQDLAAEQELQKALGALQIPPGLSVEEAQGYLPTFVAGIEKLYDLRARPIVSASPSKAEGERGLKTAAEQLIIRAIGRRRVVLVQQGDKPGMELSTRSTDQVSADEGEAGHAAIPERPGPVWEQGDGNTYVEDEDKRRTVAPEEIQARFAPRCYWEDFIPSPVRFFIRDRDYDLVCEALTQALFRRTVYWIHQLESQLVEIASFQRTLRESGMALERSRKEIDGLREAEKSLEQMRKLEKTVEQALKLLSPGAAGIHPAQLKIDDTPPQPDSNASAENIANRELQPADPRTEESKGLPPKARNWDDLTITFISDERVNIEWKDGGRETRSYEEMGFGDGRNQRPVTAWIALRELSGKSGEPMRLDKKLAQRLRSLLQKQFSIDSDPLLHAKRLGYRATFRIARGLSFEK